MNNLTVQIDLTTVPHINRASQDIIDQAEKYTLWSWYDVTLAFNEVGYQVTDTEETRIKRALFIKKLKHLMGA